MNFKVSQAIGLNSDQEAALVLVSAADETHIFLAVLRLVCDDAFTKGRQILNELSDFYFEDEGNYSQRLKDTFVNAQEKLKECEESGILISVISGKVLYCMFQGEVQAFLKRGNNLSDLSSVATQGQLISGFLQEEDRLFFATKSFVSFLGDDLDRSLLLPLIEWEEEMNLKITTVNLEYQGMAGITLEVEPEQTEVPDQIGPIMQKSIPLSEFKQETKAAKRFKFPNFFAGFKFKKTPVQSAPVVEQPFLDHGQDLGQRRGFPGAGKLFPKSGKIRLILGVLVIAVVIAGIGLQYKKSSDIQDNEEVTKLLQQAQDEYNAAKGLQTLNPQEAKNKLEIAKSTLEQALALKKDDLQVLGLQEQINQDESQILGQFDASDFPEFLDLGLIKEGFKADRLSLSDTNLLMLDPTTKTLVVVDISKKENKILAGKEQLGEAQIASLNDSFGFIYSSDKGILRVDVSNQKVAVVTKKDEDLGVVDLAGFASNVYVLDKTNNQIWKYVPAGETYTEKRAYLTEETKADFASAKKMQIESSIYVLKERGEILRFTRGAKDFFSLEGLDQPIKDPKSFFVSYETDNLYILDSGNSRLVVVNKTGAYQAQYQGKGFGTAIDLVVDEKDKKVYLLDNGKIYSTDLK